MACPAESARVEVGKAFCCLTLAKTIKAARHLDWVIVVVALSVVCFGVSCGAVWRARHRYQGEIMYVSTRLVSETIATIDSLMCDLYNLLFAANKIESGQIPNSFVDCSDTINWVVSIANSIWESANALSSLYPTTNLQSHFQKIIDGAEGVKWLVTEYGQEYPEYLRYPICKLSEYGMHLLEDVGKMNCALTEHIASTMPLSGLPANALTPEFVMQNPQAAIQYAFTLLENQIRQRIGANADLYGQDLINRAFGDRGRLTYGATQAEDIGVRNLILGAYATFRNPYMHRIIGDDEKMISIILVLIDLLAKLVNDAKDK